jgi:hypothetical protein
MKGFGILPDPAAGALPTPLKESTFKSGSPQDRTDKTCHHTGELVNLAPKIAHRHYTTPRSCSCAPIEKLQPLFLPSRARAGWTRERTLHDSARYPNTHDQTGDPDRVGHQGS